jgi:hypothetical protein
VLPLTSNYWRFQLERFHRDHLPAGIFDVPTGGADCTQPCAKSHMSYVDRLAARAAAGLSGIRTVG